ncbi:MAG: arylesterase [Deltaproteobacteria bacterium]|nr:MAG: arylesterase [Deltaproteobacteria bacterium]
MFTKAKQHSRGRAIIWLLILCLTSVVDDLAFAAPQPKVIVFLGDSITAGYGLDPSQAYPALIQEKIDAQRWQFKVVNAGQSGDTTAGGLGRMDWLLRNRVDVLVLELGGNDGLRGLPVETTKKNLQAIIDRTRAKYPAAKIVLAGMMVPPNMGRDYGQRFEAVFRDIAKQNKAALIPFVLEGVGGVRDLNLSDGIHPTAKGHEIVAANVWKVLEPILRSLLK